jgi:hypothetical protein
MGRTGNEATHFGWHFGWRFGAGDGRGAGSISRHGIKPE